MGNVELLVIAGGGGGGYDSTNQVGCGGGGSGGYRHFDNLTVHSQTYSVTIGSGGTTTFGAGNSGGDSVFDTITSAGGSGGGGKDEVAILAGGSGGGGTDVYPGGAGNTPETDPSQGNNGGNGVHIQNAKFNQSFGGGGGGAGAVGTAPYYFVPNERVYGGNGGDGLQSSISGTATYYAGGAGTPGNPSLTNGTNGLGAGNAGGGGWGDYFNPHNGKDGVVIIRYLTTDFNAIITGVGNTITIDGDYSIATFIVDGTFDVLSYAYIGGNSKIQGNTNL